MTSLVHTLTPTGGATADEGRVAGLEAGLVAGLDAGPDACARSLVSVAADMTTAAAQIAAATFTADLRNVILILHSSLKGSDRDHLGRSRVCR
jgi:hypothetical protein